MFEMRNRLAEWKIEEELDKTNEVPTSATAMAVEEILRRVDVEGRTGLMV